MTGSAISPNTGASCCGSVAKTGKSGCCGGAPETDRAACCARDEQAKAEGKAGCGCGGAAAETAAR